MKITNIEIGSISAALKRSFKTALRTLNSVENIIVMIKTDSGNVGFGEAPPTGVITGDTKGTILGAINTHIKKAIIGMDISYFEDIMIRLNKCIVNNTSARATIDMALYDLSGKIEDAGLDIEFVEQQVEAHDIEGLKFQ